jgi:uncharacterized repeat protein (TIGR04042 family)
MHFTLRWPDGVEERCYSPSLVVRDVLHAGASYRVADLVRRSRTIFLEASHRVAIKFGYACSAALDQLAAIEARAARFPPDGIVTVVAFELPDRS